MARRARSTTRLAFLRLVPVSICLSAVLALPQLGSLAWGKTTEAESHGREGRESSEEELVVCSSARRHLSHQRHRDLSRPRGIYQIASYAGHPPVVVGRQLASGLRSPLLI